MRLRTRLTTLLLAIALALGGSSVAGEACLCGVPARSLTYLASDGGITAVSTEAAARVSSLARQHAQRPLHQPASLLRSVNQYLGLRCFGNAFPSVRQGDLSSVHTTHSDRAPPIPIFS